MAASAQQKKILLVVTSMSKRNLRASVLRKLGIDVVCAAHLSDARMLWHPSTYDLVLFDMSHDTATATELCRDMKAEFPAQKVAWLVGKPGLLAGSPPANGELGSQVATRLEENLRQLMANACEPLPRRGGFLEARWRMALIRSVKPEAQSARPAATLAPVIEARPGDSRFSTFGAAVRQAEADQDDSAAERPTDSGTILLLETDDRLRGAHARALRSRGFKVRPTCNQEEAYTICAAENPDLVLVGLSDPVSNTFEVCDSLRRRHPGLKIAFVPGELLQCPISFDGVICIDGKQSFLDQVDSLIAHDELPAQPAAVS
jgi:CheY-like chemotaxis protein